MLFCLIVITSHCIGQQKEAKLFPSDKMATKETVALYNHLHALLGKKVLFGHQDDLAYGVGWQYEPGRSDVKSVTGEYPALYGWELGHLELDSAKNLDNVPFNKMKKFIRQGYVRGGAITISWHLNNPLNEKSAWDTTRGSVAAILPGEPKNKTYVLYLDRLASFIGELKGPKGEAIPILFRPFHELTGSWFWWGESECTPLEFISLWRFTVDYLRNTKKLHNILYVYSTSDFKSKENYLERYPGDEYTDVVSFDSYQHSSAITKEGNNFIKQIDSRLSMLKEIAADKNKIPAFAETGYEGIPQADWWTIVLLPLLEKYKVSYVLVWRNAGLMKETGKMHYYAPYKNQLSAIDFLKFSKNDHMMFEKKIKAANIYKF